jgi:hypothetical protein
VCRREQNSFTSLLSEANAIVVITVWPIRCNFVQLRHYEYPRRIRLSFLLTDCIQSWFCSWNRKHGKQTVKFLWWIIIILTPKARYRESYAYCLILCTVYAGSSRCVTWEISAYVEESGIASFLSCILWKRWRVVACTHFLAVQLCNVRELSRFECDFDQKITLRLIWWPKRTTASAVWQGRVTVAGFMGSGRFTPGERAPGTHWIGGWEGPRDGLDAMGKTKILFLGVVCILP